VGQRLVVDQRSGIQNQRSKVNGQWSVGFRAYARSLISDQPLMPEN
jgi:hypothetical protein